MADLKNPLLREWVAELRDDAHPTSWVVFGYTGKQGNSAVAPQAKGTGEAEEYWGSWTSQLKDDQIIFSLLRVTMGDAESRRPKFVFVAWIGADAGVMAKSRGGMHKADVKKVIGQFHLELSADTLEELGLPLVKKTIKKGMGADYDMGSNSRSASGKEGNEGASVGAQVNYTTQQSAIKAKAAAAYDGGHTVVLAGGIDASYQAKGALGAALKGEVAQGGASVYVAPEAVYTCAKKLQVRASFAMDSDKTEILKKGTTVEAAERRINAAGTVRVRLSTGGWVSVLAGDGSVCLELVSERCPVAMPTLASDSPQQFRCVKKSQIRNGFEMDSEKAGVMAVGVVFSSLCSKVNEAGALRVQFDEGWLSEVTGAGAVCLELLPDGTSVAEEGQPPAPAPAPAPPPLPEGWGAEVSKSTGDTYWRNQLTGKLTAA